MSVDGFSNQWDVATMLLEIFEHSLSLIMRSLVARVCTEIVGSHDLDDSLAELIDVLLECAVHERYLCRHFLGVE